MNEHNLISYHLALSPQTVCIHWSSVNVCTCRGTSCLCLPGRLSPTCCTSHTHPVFFWGVPLPHPHDLSWTVPCTPSCPFLQEQGLKKELPQWDPLEQLTWAKSKGRDSFRGLAGYKLSSKGHDKRWGMGVSEPELDQGMHAMVPWAFSCSVRSLEYPDSSLSPPIAKPLVSPAFWTLRTSRTRPLPWLLLLPSPHIQP